MSNWERVYKMAFASVYPQYVKKAEAKGRTREEVDEIIRWLTGYSQGQLEALLADGTDYRHFIEDAPAPNPARSEIKGLICGYRVEEIEDPFMQTLRQLDKLVDELAKGRAMEKIKRG